jgi:hypothetical protein
MPCNSGEKSEGTVPSKRATNMAIREHLLRDDTINAALVGENLRMNGSIREAHTAELWESVAFGDRTIPIHARTLGPDEHNPNAMGVYYGAVQSAVVHTN